MIKTGIILEVEDNFPNWHKNEGLAKTQEIANWLFEYCGWHTGEKFPALACCIMVIDGTKINPCCPTNDKECWVLGELIILN